MKSHGPKPPRIARNLDPELPDLPDPPEEPDDDTDLDDFDLPCTDEDDRWDAFIPEDDERDPLPDPGDFWGMERGAGSREPD